MHISPSRKMVLALILAAFGAAHVTLASAQSGTAATTDATAQGATTTPPKPTKAERKAARKEARAKKNAELKKLEDAGYNPATRNDTNYPQDLQDAQKKAGIGQGASQ